MVLTSGQPTEDQLRGVATNGFTRVINLAPCEPGRSLPDEAGLVRSLHMTYIHIPVVWTDPKQNDFAAFEQVLSQLPASALRCQLPRLRVLLALCPKTSRLVCGTGGGASRKVIEAATIPSGMISLPTRSRYLHDRF